MKARFDSQNCGIWNSFAPGSWDGHGIVFAGLCAGVRDLWRMPLSPATGQVTGPAVRLTVGSAAALSPMADGHGSLVYSHLEVRSRIASVSPQGSGSREFLTSGDGMDQQPALSPDGSKLAYSTTHAGNLDVFLKDLANGSETPVATGERAQTYPWFDRPYLRWFDLIPDPKDQVGYNHIVWRMAVGGGVPEKICEHCADMGAGPDGRLRLDLDGNPIVVVLVDHLSGKRTPYLHHQRGEVLMTVVSPDRHWVAFQAQHEDKVMHLHVAVFTQPAGPWIYAGEGVMPAWSPDGAILYHGSRQDGHLCIYARRFQEGRLVGEPWAVAHVHGAREVIGPVSPVFPWLSAGARGVSGDAADREYLAPAALRHPACARPSGLRFFAVGKLKHGAPLERILVGARTVDRRNRHIQQTQIYGQLAAMVILVVAHDRPVQGHAWHCQHCRTVLGHGPHSEGAGVIHAVEHLFGVGETFVERVQNFGLGGCLSLLELRQFGGIGLR
jgi:hypothetical protein